MKYEKGREMGIIESFDAVQAGHQEESEMVWLDEESLTALEENNPTQTVLVRCGGGRFSCHAKYARHFIEIIAAHGDDYIRDVSTIKSNR